MSTEIRDEDLLVETYRQNSPGGQQTRPSPGVRITHRPSGIGVVVDSERSQHANKQKALAKLVELLSVDIVERVERETARRIADWIYSTPNLLASNDAVRVSNRIREMQWRTIGEDFADFVRHDLRAADD